MIDLLSEEKWRLIVFPGLGIAGGWQVALRVSCGPSRSDPEKRTEINRTKKHTQKRTRRKPQQPRKALKLISISFSYIKVIFEPFIGFRKL